MVQSVVGRLGVDGWAITVAARMQAMVDNYLHANFSQSVVYYGKIKSFIYTKARNLQNKDALVTGVEKDLTSLVENVFPENESYTIDVSTEDIENTAKFRLIIGLNITISGKSYDLNEIYSFSDEF